MSKWKAPVNVVLTAFKVWSWMGLITPDLSLFSSLRLGPPEYAFFIVLFGGLLIIINWMWIASVYPPTKFKKAYPKFRECQILTGKRITRQKMSAAELEELKGHETIIDAFHELRMLNLEIYDSVYRSMTTDQQYNLWGELCYLAEKGKVCEARKFIKNLTLKHTQISDPQEDSTK